MRITVGVFVVAASCASTGTSDLARGQFVATYHCKTATVAPRGDLGRLAYEVFGCGRDVIYRCVEARTDYEGNLLAAQTCVGRAVQ